MPNKRQAIIWTNADPIDWCIYAALGGDELKIMMFRWAIGSILMQCLSNLIIKDSELIIWWTQIKHMNVSRPHQLPSYVMVNTGSGNGLSHVLCQAIIYFLSLSYLNQWWLIDLTFRNKCQWNLKFYASIHVLTHWGLVTQICVGSTSHHWFR